jgi:soluble lytic murein transglycosylase-like protein
MFRILYLIGLCGLALPVWGGESIVLRTGFRLSADRHEIAGNTIRIFSGDGITEMSASLVESVETLAVAEESVQAAVAPISPPERKPAMASATEAPVPARLTPLELAESAAHKYSLPDAFVAGVMCAESGFNMAAISRKGAIGLMQLMPATARDLGADPTKPNENADAGTRYLRDLLALYEGKPDQVVLALAAYNAGPAAVDKYHGVPPFRETREYILRVLKAWNPPLAAR